VTATVSVKGKKPKPGPWAGGKTVIELLMECNDEAAAHALNEALMPDNRHFPRDQRFDASIEGSIIRFTIASPRARPALSTVASIISDARLFRDIWVEVKTRGLGNAAQQ